MLHHNFTQCVCIGHTSIEHALSLYIYCELLLVKKGIRNHINIKKLHWSTVYKIL